MAAPKFTPQMTVPQFERLFPDDDACKAYLVARRWPHGVHCARCGNHDVYPVANKPFHWQCSKCAKAGGYRFSVIAKTIFDNTKIGLKTWFRVIHLMLTSKKGVSSLQIHRMMGFGSYSTALYMCHRVRAGLVDPEFRKLMGIVEVDETYRRRQAEAINTRRARAACRQRARSVSDKAAVVGAVEPRRATWSRASSRTPRPIRSPPSSTKPSRPRSACFARMNGSAIGRLKKQYPHKTVDHSEEQYVVGAVHTQTIDGFWSLIKRGMVGTFHKVSKKYLPLYVAEFEFRYNNRGNPDIFGTAIGRC